MRKQSPVSKFTYLSATSRVQFCNSSLLIWLEIQLFIRQIFKTFFFFNQAMTCIYEAGISNSVSYLSSYTATDKSKSKRWHLMTAEYTCISPFDIYIKKTWELNEKKKLDIWKYINSYLHLITIHGLSFSREKN